MAALLCDPISGECALTLSPPAGESCCVRSGCFDSLCAPDEGLVCLPSGECGGLGPDGQPMAPWAGVSCPAPGGVFQVLFDVGTTSSDFFRLPFPNDARLNTDGRVSLTGFPTPPLEVVPSDLLGRYVQAIEAEQNGFGPNQSVFLRFSDRPLFCASGCDTAGNCAPGCMGRGEPAPSVYLVDITASSYRFTPINYRWFASTGSTPYMCGPYVAVVPGSATPWEPGHTYAVFVHSRILSASNQPMVQAADFAAMLGTSAPADLRLNAAWAAYSPLRGWLATSPPYPAGDPDAGNPVLTAHLGGAAVFTVRDPTATLLALGDAIEARADPAVTSVIACTGAAPPATCASVAGLSFVEAQGLIDLPVYQQGTPPYVDQGGGIALDGAGVPQEQRIEPVRFALSVPTGGMPASGWPVVIYAHGTGGSYQSHLV
ncbi:MAG: hypothetical protein HYZ27_04900, partial [Deltaproteobacteria bacterium]|nr:hypothetical protein [Deltaproteobacteria bacterium]